MKAILCGRFGGPRRSSAMVIAFGAPRCQLVERWHAFRFDRRKLRWQRLDGHRGVARGIRRAGNRIKEVAPIRRSGRSCRVHGKKWRLWHWNGKRFVPGPWHTSRGTGRKNRRRLVLSPKVAPIAAAGSAQFRVRLFEGSKDLGDVTHRTVLDLQKQHYAKCNRNVQIFDTPYCSRMGSCDQAFVCSAISPGEWLLRAYGKFGRYNLTSNYASLLVTPKENLTITPDSLDPVIYGLEAERQLHVEGAEGPVRWEAEIRHEGPGGYYSESLTPIPNLAGALDVEHLEENVAQAKKGRYFVLDPLTGMLTGTIGHGLAPWSARVAVRAWDPAGNSGEKEYELSSVPPPPCASACAHTGTNLSVGIAWRDQPACDYGYRIYESGVPWPYFILLDRKVDYGNGTFTPGDFVTFDLPEGRQNWLTYFAGGSGSIHTPDSPGQIIAFDPFPGQSISFEVGCFMENQDGFDELISSVTSNTVVLH